ncbi:hypothetical protein [uncultured Brevundimonas sp.]|uniref:hypothetical protein n=1 Tax=uncultured Brevundimonas sp. TaxID=213418 RepID=UPI0025F14A9C|nr:hypothetical protein [uncultured Brevundimonas sp.]
MDQTITSLIEKLEGAEVGSRDLDCAVARVFGCYRGFASEHLTTSLDAALALAERVLTLGAWDVGYTYNSDRPHYARLVIVRDDEGQPEIYGRSATPALALCAALLRAQSEARV